MSRPVVPEPLSWAICAGLVALIALAGWVLVLQLLGWEVVWP